LQVSLLNEEELLDHPSDSPVLAWHNLLTLQILHQSQGPQMDLSFTH